MRSTTLKLLGSLFGLVLVAGSGCLPSTPSPHYWTKYRSTFVNNGIGTDSDADGRLVWQQDVGAQYSTPCIGTNGLLYIGGKTQSGTFGLHALDPKNRGTEKWFGLTGAVIRSSPGYFEGKVFVGCDDSKLYGWNADTGTEIFNFQMRGQIWTSPTFFTIQRGGSFVNVVCVGDVGGTVRAVNVDNDKDIVWENINSSAGGTLLVSPAVGPVSPTLGSGQLVYFGTDHGKIFALDCQNGVEKWNKTYGSEVKTSPIFAGSRIYVSSVSVLNPFQFGGKMFALDSETGESIWEFPSVADSYFTSAALAAGGGTLYVGDVQGRLIALNSQGKPVWPFPAGRAGRLSEQAVDSARIYAGSGFDLVAIDRNNEQIQILYSTFGFIRDAGPIIGPDGTIFCPSSDGTLYAIKRKLTK
jgi:outer membrane protein assembly factor BamB